MTVRKVNLYALCVLALLPAFVLWRFIVGQISGWGSLLFAFFFVIVAWGIGIFLGVGLAVVVKRPSAEPYLYLTSQFAVILTIIVFAVKTIYTDRKHKHDLENVKDNHSFVNFEKSSYSAYSLDYVRTAFRKLESKFDDPNSFHLEKYSCWWKDTVINSAPDTIYSIHFMYLKQNRVLFAKVTVLGDSAVINSMDSERKPDPENQLMKAGAYARRLVDLEDLKRSLQAQDLPDSIRNKILDIMSHPEL
jgi:hypothetical protein